MPLATRAEVRVATLQHQVVGEAQAAAVGGERAVLADAVAAEMFRCAGGGADQQVGGVPGGGTDQVRVGEQARLRLPDHRDQVEEMVRRR
ncbi:hypothetical protein [Pseudomonas aeruginosa]|uniref:hypothetical protein n=1 Tax=Pseudomonas aeruginosa TaxID=287 RepID=UPI001E43EC62|nr:hypothetical protein [Pseudomonas aeruginosa]